MCDEDKPSRAIGRVMFYWGKVLIYYSPKPAGFNCLRGQLLFYNTNAAELKTCSEIQATEKGGKPIGQYINKKCLDLVHDDVHSEGCGSRRP